MNIQKSPFKFLDAYTQQDKKIFFGRDEEIRDIYRALSGVKHLLVYGPSGAGKTSLIECGLRNQFSDADWYALTIRRGADLNQSVLAAIRESLDDASELPDDTPFGKAIERLFAERFQPVYLLFDQFEELLISAEAEEKKTFFKNLNDLIQYKVPCRVLLIMREEFVGHLSEYEKECPSIFQHRFRLEKMGRANVRAVILNTLQADQYHDDFSVAAPDALTEEILSKLPDNQRVIELAHVQVFLNELWERAHQNQSYTTLPQLHADLVNDKDSLQTVLDEFLKKQIDILDHTYGEHNTLYTLAAMISERDTKLQVSQAEIEDSLQQNEVTLPTLNQLLDTLAKRRIIRTLKSGGQTQYEISHDLLAKVVGDNRTEEMKMQDKARRRYNDIIEEEYTDLLSQKDINTLRRYEEVLPFSPDLEKLVQKSEGRLKAKRRRQTAGLLAFSAFALLIAGIAFYFYQDAEEQAIIAQDKTQNLENVLDALYFYEDSLALAYNEDEGFGFIDKKGKVLIDYKYVEALPFSNRGYAKVKKANDTDCIIDTKGNEYRFTDDIDRLDKNIEAFDFSVKSGFDTDETLKKILDNKQLKILFLNSCNIGYLPIEIGQLTNLQDLGLVSNNLTSLPIEIGQLTNLRTLSLNGNDLTFLPAKIGQLINLQKLDLRVNNLTSLPTEIGQLTNLQYLNLSNNDLNSLPVEIGQLINLQELDLTRNNLTSLPTEIKQLTKLQSLNLFDNNLMSLPNEVGLLTNLQYLNLSSNDLTSLPMKISQLTNLESLDLRSNDNLTSLPAEVEQLINLQTLRFGSNNLASIHIEIEQLNNLQHLYLSGTNLTSLPREISQLTNLESLNLRSNNNLTSLPREIGQLTNLQSLYLAGNDNLSSLPTEIGQLVNLQSLYLAGNSMTSLPVEIGQLTNLQNLYLVGTNLTSLPAEIGQLKNLQDLDLSSNRNLSSLPTEIKQLTNLQILNLNSNNNLTSLPTEIGQLTNLGILNLRDNNLTSLPAEIGQLKNVQGLYLNDNNLTSLPTEIGQLTNLRSIDLNDNNLTSFPAEIGQLKNLQNLYLGDNNLTLLPTEIEQLTDLWTLALNDNNLTSLPTEIGQLTNLRNLYLRSNSLASLPIEIGELTNLTVLFLDDNNLTSLPTEIKKLINLKTLGLRKTNLSKEDVQKIKKLLPNCNVIF